METAEETPRPVLVDPQKKIRKRRTMDNLSSKPPEDNQKMAEAPPEPVSTADLQPPDGKPDHSLVPTPRKKNLPAAEAVSYWNSVPPRERDSWFIAYVYRDLPVCDPYQPLSAEELRDIERKKKRKPEMNCGKLTDPLSIENWQQEVKMKFGAGDYHVKLNDQHQSVASTVVEFELSGGRDWDSHPPVLELNQVVLSDPRNDSYIRWARLKGIRFPGDPGAEPLTPFDNEEEMANVAAVEKLTDALIEQSRRPQVVPPAPQPPPPPDRSNEILADAALKGQQILLDSIKAQGKAQDPMEFHKAVTEAAKAMVPPPIAPQASSGPSLVDIMALVNSMMAPIAAQNAAMLAEVRSRAEAAERRAEAAEQRAQTAAHPPAPAVNPEVANPVKNAIDLIKALGTLRDSASGILGPEDPEDGLPVWAKLGSKLLDNAPGMLHNIAVMATKSGTPQPPPELEPELVAGETQQPAVEAGQPKQEEEVFSKAKIAQEIAAPLINSLNQKKRGFEFAAGMILTPKILGFPGRVVYEMAVEEGPDGMMRILQSYQPLWQQLVRIPNQFNVFLTEFFDRKMAYQVAEGSQQQPQVQPQPPAAAASPEVLPPVNGRTVLDPQTGKPVQTVGKKGPIVNGTVQPGPVSA